MPKPKPRKLLANLTDLGLPGIGKVPFGAHFCHFYFKRQDLIDSLVPYFQAGLKNNERCLWITAHPLRAVEARAEMDRAIPNFRRMLQDGRIQISNEPDSYRTIPARDGGDLLGIWLREEERALADGYQGLRVAGNTSYVTPMDWDRFMTHEHQATQALEHRRIVALCSYRAIQCQATDAFEAIRSHHYTLGRREDSWEVLEGAFDEPAKPKPKSSRPAPVPLHQV